MSKNSGRFPYDLSAWAPVIGFHPVDARKLRVGGGPATYVPSAVMEIALDRFSLAFFLNEHAWGEDV
jgi:hypothetical protein